MTPLSGSKKSSDQTEQRLQRLLPAPPAANHPVDSLPEGGPFLENTPLSKAWYCRPCNRWFGRKSSLAVHFSKLHSRAASYRLEVAGTICQACGKQFWAENKLAIHLRASAECVAILRHRGHIQRKPQVLALEVRNGDSGTPTSTPPPFRPKSRLGAREGLGTGAETGIPALTDLPFVRDLPGQGDEVLRALSKGS